MITTPGQLVVNEVLPEELQDHAKTLTSDAAEKLLAQVAKLYPNKYREISHALLQLGRQSAYTQGVTLSLKDLRMPVEERKEMLEHVRKQVKIIEADKMMSAEEKQQAMTGVFGEVQKYLTDETYKRTIKSENPFALQVESKARGNKAQLAGIMTTPSLYDDAEDNLIPVFIEHSYGEGLRPHEYWAGTYGARKGVVSTKFATRDAGYLGKQFTQAAMKVVVTGDDCETTSGIPVSAVDEDNIGTVLQRPVAGFPRGTVINTAVMSKLQADKTDEIVVRSPLTCGLSDGICKQCAGVREGGDFPNVGDNIGISAASALAERIAQSSLNVKHVGGIAGDKDRVYAGFPIVEQLFEVPQTFPNRAAVASLDGRIDKIEEAPQGGSNIHIGEEVHYALPDTVVTVKEGDIVEAGDQLSSGIVNPREVVQHKGLGEGRRYFVERATKAFRDSGYRANRRNIEAVARGMMDFETVTDPEGAGDYLPGDVVSHSALSYSYRPRKDAASLNAKQAIGMYLEEPALHYTIGTRLTPNMVKRLELHGYPQVLAHAQPPPFEPYMASLREAPQHEQDWMAQLGSRYLKTNPLKNVHRGATSSPHGLHPVPAIAKATEIGRKRGPGY